MVRPAVGISQAYENAANLASLANGARPAVAKDQLAGWEHQVPTLHLNDGIYGHAAGWVGNSTNSWIKIDLGRERYIGRVKLGRDRTGDRRLHLFVIRVGGTALSAVW